MTYPKRLVVYTQADKPHTLLPRGGSKLTTCGKYMFHSWEVSLPRMGSSLSIRGTIRLNT